MIRGYVAMSLDGYIAAPGGDLDWLTKYDTADFGAHGYASFIKDIATIVMGRATYDWVRAAGMEWPYDGTRVIVVTSRPIEQPPRSVETWSEGVERLVRHLRSLGDGDVWIAGGGLLQQAVIAVSGLDRLELFIVPELLGEGTLLFPPNHHRRGIKLRAAERLDRGVTWLDYDFAAA
jgi:dihydrofolate reductase